MCLKLAHSHTSLRTAAFHISRSFFEHCQEAPVEPWAASVQPAAADVGLTHYANGPGARPPSGLTAGTSQLASTSRKALKLSGVAQSGIGRMYLLKATQLQKNSHLAQSPNEMKA